MLKNFWWPLEFSHVVKNKPIRVTALEQEFVLYRTPDGVAHVLSDLCVHRGGALSDGWMEGDFPTLSAFTTFSATLSASLAVSS